MSPCWNEAHREYALNGPTFIGFVYEAADLLLLYEENRAIEWKLAEMIFRYPDRRDDELVHLCKWPPSPVGGKGTSHLNLVYNGSRSRAPGYEMLIRQLFNTPVAVTGMRLVRVEWTP